MGAVLRDMPPMDAYEAVFISELASSVEDVYAGRSVEAAFDRIESEMLDNDQKIHLWSLLQSNVRSALKEEGEKRKVAA